jgi:hypothetical protein
MRIVDTSAASSGGRAAGTVAVAQASDEETMRVRRRTLQVGRRVISVDPPSAERFCR